MGTTPSAQRIGKYEEDAVADEGNTGPNEAEDNISEDKLLQKNEQDSSLMENNENHSEDVNGYCEERDHGDVGSGIVTLKEETDDLEEYVSEASADNLGKEIVKAGGVTRKEENEANGKPNDVEVGLKKILRFVGFKFTLKKDKCDTTAAKEPVINEQDGKVTGSSMDSRDTRDKISVCIKEKDAEEMQKESIRGKISIDCRNSDLSSETDSELPAGQMSEFTDYNEQIISDIELLKDVQTNLEPEEHMSPIKQFFTQGIWASLRKRRKEEEASKENKDKLIEITQKEEGDKFNTAAQEDSTCVCLDVFNITFEEGKALEAGERHEGMSATKGALMNAREEEKVQDSPFRRICRLFSPRRQKQTKPDELNLINSKEYPNENLQSFIEFVKVEKEEKEAMVEQPKPTEGQDTDVRSEESKKKFDSTISWETLICGGSTKKRSRKTFNAEVDTQDKGEEPRKTTASPLGSSIEGDYDRLTSSNENTESPAEGEGGSTWKSLKKLVTPKRKVRTEESGSTEQIPSDSEFTKDESSCSIKKLIPRRKKRKSNRWQEHSSSDETGKGTATDTEDDDTPLVVPLSEYEITEPESFKETTEKTVKYIPVIEMQPMTEQDKSKEKKLLKTPTCTAGPPFTPILPGYVEDLTEFLSKYQQLSDIPEEGIIEESVQTPVSSAEWTTQDDTLAEDFIDLTADAVTAPELISEQCNDDETTEMISAVSHLTESPKTSRNITPVPSKNDLTDPDLMHQDTAETVCRTQSLLSFKTTNGNSDILAVSVCVESTVSGKTRVLLAHDKTEATPICMGPVSQEVKLVEEFISLSLVEGIPETNEAVPPELLFEDFPEESEEVGIATNESYEAEVSEVDSEFHDAHSDDNTPFDKTEKKAEIPTVRHTDLLEESQKDETINVILVEEKTEEAERLNKVDQMVAHYIPNEVMNTANAHIEKEFEATAGVVVPGMYDRLEEITKGSTVENNTEPIPAEESGDIVTRGFHSNTAEDLSGSLNELRCEEKNLLVMEASLLEIVPCAESKPAEETKDISKLTMDLEKYPDLTPVQDLKTKQYTGCEVDIISDIRAENEVVSIREPVISDQPTLQMEFAEKGRQSLTNTRAGSQPKSQIDFEVSANIQTTEAAQESVEKKSLMTQEVKRACVEVEAVTPDTHLKNVPETRERTVQLEADSEITTEPQETDTATTSPKIEPQSSREQVQIESEFEKKSRSQFGKGDTQVIENTVKVTEIISQISIIYVGETNCSTVTSSTDKESKETEDTSELEKYKAANPGGESETSMEPVANLQRLEETFANGRAMGTSIEAVSTNNSVENTEVHLESLLTPEPTELCCEVVSKHKSEIIISSDRYTYSPDRTQHEVTELQIDKIAVSAVDSETLAMVGIKDELISESAEQVAEPMVIKNKIKTLTITQPEVEKQVKSQLKVETLETENIHDTTPPVEISVIKDTKVQSHFLTLIKEPEVTEDTTDVEALTLREIHALVQDSQTNTVEQPPGILPVLKEAEMLADASKEKDSQANTPVADEVKELTLEMSIAAESPMQTSVVIEPRDQIPLMTSALETETLMRTHEENNLHSDTSVVTLVKEVGSTIMTAVVNETQLKASVSPVAQTPIEVSGVQESVVLLLQEPQTPHVAHELRETKPGTPCTVDITAPKFETSVVTEIKVAPSGVTEAGAKTPVVTVTEVTPVKEDMLSSITSAVEERVKPLTVALGLQILTMVPAQVHLPNLSPMEETLANDTEVKEIEAAVAGPQYMERQNDASFEANVEVKLPSLTEPELKVTEMIKKVSVEAQNADSKEVIKSHETVSKALDKGKMTCGRMP